MNSEMLLSRLKPEFNIAGFQSRPALDDYLGWEVVCGGLCLVVLLIVIVWLIWKWWKARSMMNQVMKAQKQPPSTQAPEDVHPQMNQ